MSQHNVKTATHESKETSGLTAVLNLASRRAYPFRSTDPDTSAGAIMALFGFSLDSLHGFRNKEEVSDFTNKMVWSLELDLRKAQERLGFSVSFIGETALAPEEFQVRIVHCANKLGPDSDVADELAEYETSNIYLAEGVAVQEAFALYQNDRAGLSEYARNNLEPADKRNPFFHWDFTRNGM